LQISVKVALLYKGRIIHRQRDVDLHEDASLADLFKALDRAKLVGRSYFKRLAGSPRPPTLLRNGDRVDLPGDLTIRLCEGDEISVISPFSGG